MGLSNVMSQSLISAGNSMKMAEIQHGIKKRVDDKAGVLNAEIKLDGGRGGDVTKKKEELKEAEEKAAELNAAAAETLGDLIKGLKNAAEEDLKETRAEKRQAEEAAKKKAEKEERSKKLNEAGRKEANKERENESSDAEIGSVYGILENAVNIAAEGVTPDTGIVKNIGVNVDIKI